MLKEIPSKLFNEMLDEWIHRELYNNATRSFCDFKCLKCFMPLICYDLNCRWNWNKDFVNYKKARKIARRIQKLIINNCVYEV